MRRAKEAANAAQCPLVIAHSLLGDHRGYGRLVGAAFQQCAAVYALKHRGLSGATVFSLDANGAVSVESFRRTMNEM